MNAMTEVRSAIPALAMNEDELVMVLQTSLYPGAALSSIKMVLGYCRASGLDPMQKPVHVVPMWSRDQGKMVDVIMPGIGLYRTQAARSGQFAGISEPVYGPDKTFKLGGAEIDAPEWCRVTAKRLLPSGHVAEFTATEYWVENYAVKGGKDKSIAPNAMWTKRPRGQISKCAQAQALRMAFPEMTGSAPTADEMEGREIDMGQATEARAEPKELPPYPQADFDANLAQWRALIADGKKPERIIAMVSTKFVMTSEQRAELNRPIDEVMAEQTGEVVEAE